MLAKIVDFPGKSKSDRPTKETDSLSTVLGFLNRIALIVDRADNFDQATQQVFAEVCRYTTWPIGHIYVVDTSNPENYISGKVWYREQGLDAGAIADFRKMSEETVFQRGKGLIGLIAQDREAKAVEDVTVIKQFLRADAAKRSGVRGFFGFPIIVDTKCVAVAEFYGREIGLLDETSLEIMKFVSSQLARLYERERNIEFQQNLTVQFENSVQASATELVECSTQLDELGTRVQTQASKSNEQSNKVDRGRKTILESMTILQDAMVMLLEAENQTLESKDQVNMTVGDLAQNVTEALADLRKLGAMTANIEGIARNVSEVSAQVRMLGLNASIEAARAGVAGKGFAIVAAEIKSLAQQSEQSSQDISNQLGGIQSIANAGISAMESVNDSMLSLEETATQLSNVVQDQHNATETIRTNLDSAQTTFGEISTDIQDMNRVSEDLVTLASNVSENVTTLHNLSETIAVSSQDFITAIQSN